MTAPVDPEDFNRVVRANRLRAFLIGFVSVARAVGHTFVLACGVMTIASVVMFSLDVDGLLRWLWRLTDHYVAIDQIEKAGFRRQLYGIVIVIWAILLAAKLLNFLSAKYGKGRNVR